jgi:hypothetical protein
MYLLSASKWYYNLACLGRNMDVSKWGPNIEGNCAYVHKGLNTS